MRDEAVLTTGMPSGYPPRRICGLRQAVTEQKPLLVSKLCRALIGSLFGNKLWVQSLEGWNMLRTSALILVAVLTAFGGICRAQEAPREGAEALECHRRCRQAFARGDIDEAIDFAKKAIELDSANSKYHLWLGIAYSEKTEKGFFISRLSNARKCKKAFERGVELDSTSASAREGLLEFLVRAPGIAGGSRDEAKEQAAKIAGTDAVRGHLAFAYVYQREGDSSRAENELKKAVTKSNGRPDTYCRLAGWYVNREEFEKAADIYLECALYNPEAPRPYYELGWFWQTQGEDQRAVEAFRKILRINPGDINAHFFVAVSYLDQSAWTKAAESISEIVAVDPDYPGLGYLEGRRALRSGTGLEEGVKAIEAYLDRDPQESYNPEWTYTHLMAGITSYRPSWAEARMTLGMLHEKLGNKKEASKQYEEALNLNPRLREAASAIESLK